MLILKCLGIGYINLNNKMSGINIRRNIQSHLGENYKTLRCFIKDNGSRITYEDSIF